LIDLQNSITAEINESEVGCIFEVLVEGPSQKNPELLKGMTRHFKTVHFPHTDRTGSGGLVRVRAEQSHPWGFSASFVED
nr:TRAM domain-containing protein [Armatimonadota bacterium]